MSNYPPGVSDRDFTDETGTDYSDPANRIEEPPACDVCANEPAYVRNLDDGKWYGLDCAFKAGEPSAALWKAHKSANELLERISMPVKDIGEAA